MEEHSTAVDDHVEKAKETIHQYGLALLLAANVFGVESIRILTESRVSSDFSPLRVSSLALGAGLTMHGLSARDGVTAESEFADRGDRA